MQNRYTTKVYNSTKKVSQSDVNELAQILTLSPSSINSQPWRFIIIGNQEIKEKLATYAKHNQQRVIDCSHLIVFTRFNNIELFEEQLKQLPSARLEYFLKNKKPIGKEKIYSWFNKQVYLSLGVLLTACANMGIDATPMEGIEADNFDKILDLVDHSTVVATCIGYRDKEDFNDPIKAPKRRISIDKVVKQIH